MSEIVQVTLSLPRETYDKLMASAGRANKSIGDILIDEALSRYKAKPEEVKAEADEQEARVAGIAVDEQRQKREAEELALAKKREAEAAAKKSEVKPSTKS